MRTTQAISALVLVFCGKGGVGKTTKATSTGVWLASTGKRVCIIDTDRGHSVPRALGLKKGSVPKNALHNVGGSLDIVVIDQSTFINVVDAKEKGGIGMENYLKQFPQDKGLIAWADILNGFFGAPTDTTAVDKFITLV